MKEPTMCGECRKREARSTILDYKVSRTINEEEFNVVVPNLQVLKCSNCETIWLDEMSDRLVWKAVMKTAGYLLPEEVKAIRIRFKLKISELTVFTHIQEEDLERIENGYQFQTREEDRRLRALKVIPGLAMLHNPTASARIFQFQNSKPRQLAPFKTKLSTKCLFSESIYETSTKSTEVMWIS